MSDSIDPCPHVCVRCGGCPDCCDCTTQALLEAALIIQRFPQVVLTEEERRGLFAPRLMDPGRRALLLGKVCALIDTPRTR